jgi:hypothetical protein
MVEVVGVAVLTTVPVLQRTKVKFADRPEPEGMEVAVEVVPFEV